MVKATKVKALKLGWAGTSDQLYRLWINHENYFPREISALVADVRQNMKYCH